MISIVDAGCVVSFERIYAHIGELERNLFELRDAQRSTAGQKRLNMTLAQIGAEFDRRNQELPLVKAAIRPLRLLRSSLLAISQKGYDAVNFGPLISLTSGFVGVNNLGGSTSTSIEGFLCVVKKT
jgi:hypothetical protein